MATLICAAIVHVGRAEEVRTWTDSTGKQKVKAKFEAFADGTVTLRRPGSKKVIRLSLTQLSDADQDYVIELLDRIEEAAEEEAADKAASQADSIASEPTQTGRVPNNVVNSVRGAVFRTQTISRLKQVVTGLLQYEAAKGEFPPAAIMTADGKPGLSWRVAILPMIEQEALYRQFKLDEPWDSDHNKALVAQMPSIYESPGSDVAKGYTNYLAVVSTDTIIASGDRGTKMRSIRDGTSSTIMVVEVDDSYATIWTKPEDYPWDKSKPAYGLGNIWTGSFIAAFGDASVKRVELKGGSEQLNAYFSTNAGDRVR